MMKKIALGSFYVFYAVLLTAVLLVVRFPKERFLRFAAAQLEQRIPGTSWSIGDVHYRFPDALDVEQVRLEIPDELFQLDLNQVHLKADLNQPGKAFMVAADLFGGSLSARLVADWRKGLYRVPMISVKGIELGSIKPLEQRLDRKVNGSADFAGTIATLKYNLKQTALKGKIGIHQLNFPLKRPILQSDRITFADLSFEAIMENGELRIDKGTGTGDLYNTRFGGSIGLKPQWQESDLLINGDLLPSEIYLQQNRQVARAAALLFKKYRNRTIPYQVSGTFRQPVFQFGQF